MSYLEESLSADEIVVAIFQRHWVTVLPVIGWTLLVITIPLAIYQYLQLRFLEQAVTNKRLVHKTGIVSRRTSEIKIVAIETIDLHQTFIGRVLNFGTVLITGRGSSRVILSKVRNPVSVKRSIEGLMGVGT